ncbi:hypothetical protein PHPALM_30581 [Phytophthora palmivora]|uniref:Gag protein n=1 Tax=Phytophthora palmivora TaxID=4796 RepID=A0A2P4X4T4_9STRA|nr:hypothetical protein PHPALM_30581 [Phytophthora palmivora]
MAETTAQVTGGVGSPVGAGHPTGEDLIPRGRSTAGARHRGLARLGALETRMSSDGLLVVHASTVEQNGDKYADALRESKGRGQVSDRLAGGTVVNVPGVRMDLAVKFEDFDSTESFLSYTWTSTT